MQRLASFTIFFTLASAGFADTITLNPAATTVYVGNTITLAVTVHSATDLYAYQFDLGFDPTVLQAVSVSEGPFLTTQGSTVFFEGLIDNPGGLVSFISDSLVGPIPGVNGDGVLALVRFEAAGTGSSAIQILGPVFVNSSLATTTPNVVSASVQSNAVPEPNSVALLLAGSACLAVLSSVVRRKRPVL